MSAPDLCYLSALEALAAFRSGELSPLDYLEALIARSEEINPRVNAWTHTYWERSRAEAKQAEARYLGQGGGPAIMGGDFNMVPWSETLDDIADAAGFERAGPSRPTFQLGPFPLPIDHVFAPAGGRVEVRGLSGSDHRGLLARVRLTD